MHNTNSTIAIKICRKTIILRYLNVKEASIINSSIFKQNLLSSHLFPTPVTIKTHKTIILPAVLCAWEIGNWKEKQKTEGV